MDDKNNVSESNKKEQVQQTLRRWAKAVEESDLNTIGRLTSENAIFWTHGAPELRGREALENAFKPYFNQYNMKQDFQLDEIIISDDIAFVRGLEINRLTSLEDNSETVVRQRVFSILKNEPDG